MLQPLTRSVDVGSLEVSYDLGFATFTSVTSGYEEKSDATSDNSGFYQQVTRLRLRGLSPADPEEAAGPDKTAPSSKKIASSPTMPGR